MISEDDPVGVETTYLWETVCDSDPGTLKHVTQRGGFTAIAAQAQIKRATELWGPYGYKWGLRDCKFSGLPGQDGAGLACLTLDATFFYPCSLDGVVREAVFEISSDIAYDPRGECRKKLMTDVTTKALSKLGFNADVFLDQMKWDGNKYINKVKKEQEQSGKLAAVVDLQKIKDDKTKNFVRACVGTGASADQISKLLGVEGYESLNEITVKEKRVAFVKALREMVDNNPA